MLLPSDANFSAESAPRPLFNAALAQESHREVSYLNWWESYREPPVINTLRPDNEYGIVKGEI